MNFGQLKAYVESAMGRSDVPDYVYMLTTAGINRDCRFLDMENYVEVVLTSQTADLPADFQSVIAIHTRIGGSASGTRIALQNVTTQGARLHSEPGYPRFFAIKDKVVLVHPDPDGEYELYIDYIGALADLVAETDTNDVMSRYPDLYLYQALTHAAIWAKDGESEQSYGRAYAAALNLAKKDDMNRRNALGVTTRSLRL